MKILPKLWENMMARRTMSIVLCAALSVTATGICAATTSDLAEETARAREAVAAVEETTGESAARDGEHLGQSQVSTEKLEGIPLENDTGAQEEPEEEDTRCIHTFTQAWAGYECKLTDYVSGYEPGDEVRIQAVFNKQVGSQFGMYIDGAWNAFPGEGKTRNITLIPDSDYLNIQITDMKGLPSVNLADISVEISKKGEADSGSYLHRFTGLWQGFETRFSDYNPDYEPGDEVKVTVVYNKKVTSQMGMNIGGAWTTESGEGKTLVKTITPDNDYLNIQISDMWASYSVGIVSISVEITKKGPGVSAYGGGGGLTTRNYTQPGDYLLFNGEINESYNCNDAWIQYCADTDYLTLTYTCAPEHENWGVLGWQATLDGEWTNGPSYSADAGDSTREVSQTFSVRYLRKMMGITEDTNVGSLSLGAWSEGQIKDLTLHVGSEIPRDMHLFQDGAPNQAWVCTDIERILDLPDEKYICVQYTCATPDYEGWTILTWGASVNGEWKNGKSYKTSTREATRNHFDSMRMDAFRNMLHLSWDAKVDSVTLSAYNDGRILDIWISDTKVEDPGNSKKDKVDKESRYSSGNGGLWNRVEGTEGDAYDQNISLNGWEWASGDKSLKDEDKIIQSLREQTYLVLEYTPKDADAPSLQFTMWDGKQKQITASDAGDGRAIFAYKDIAVELSGYLIPQEIRNLQVSASEDDITLVRVRVVKDDSDPKDVPIAVLASDWSGFGTEISKWHSEFQVGDTVTVTVTFDKRAPGYIAYNSSPDNWDRGAEMYGEVITRTFCPYNDHMDITIGAIPENKRYVIIRDIKVEIAGKRNFNDYVILEGGANMGRLACTTREAATAALTDAEIQEGTRLVLTMEKAEPDAQEQEAVRAVFGDQAEDVHVALAVDINVYKEDSKKNRTRITETMSPIPLKITVPRDLEKTGNDFAMVRDHEGELEFLEDRDGNPDTVTFRSDAFSRFTMVYGEPGAFDGISGAVRSFRSEWDTFSTSFSTYFERYQPGKPTTVTLTFEKPVKAYVDYNAPDWTRVEGSGLSTTFTTTVIPADDSLGIGIADLGGNSKVKLLSVKVEQEMEKIYGFDAAGQVFETAFDTYNRAFVPGFPAKVTLTFDNAVISSIGYNAPDEKTVAGTSPAKVMTVTITPEDNNLRIWLTSLCGSKTANLVDVTVEQDFSGCEAIHTYRSTYTGMEEDRKITDYYSEFQPGDKVKVTLIFDKKVQSGLVYYNPEWTREEGNVSSTSLTKTVVPQTDAWNAQIVDLCGNEAVSLLYVYMEPVEEDPLYTFTLAENSFTSAFDQYDETFETARETTVNLTFDKPVKAQIRYKGTEGDAVAESTEYSRNMTFTITPADKTMEIQITDMNGNTIVKLVDVSVEQEDLTDAVYKFTDADFGWSAGHDFKFSDFNSSFEAGRETTVTLVFDKEINSRFDYTDKNLGWQGIEGSGRKEVIITGIPDDDSFNVKVTDPKGADVVYLLSVKVEQKQQTEALHEFTSAWAGFETSFETYNDQFQSGKETTVTLTFDKEVKAQVGYHDGNDSGAFKNAEGTSISRSLTVTFLPSDDYMNIQIMDMNGNASVNLLSVDVKQKTEEESLHEFTEAWSGFEPKLSDYNPAFEFNKETEVTLTFDKEVKAQVGYHDGNNSGAYKNAEGTSISKSLTVTFLPSDDYMNIQIMDMNGNASVNLLSVSVEQGERPVATIKNEDSDKSYCIKVSELCPGYQAGDKVTVTVEMRSDGSFNGGLAGNVAEANPAWVSNQAEFTSDGNNEATATWNYVPDGDCFVQIWNMSGTKVDIMNVNVAKGNVQAPVATITGTGDNGTYVIEIGKLCTEYQAGDTVTVTAEMSSDGYFKGRLGGNVQDTGWSQQEFESENNEARITWTYVPDGDCSIQMWNLDGTKVDIDSLTVEVVDQKPVATITGTGDNGTYVIEIGKLCTEYQAGDTVTVTAEMSSDGYFKGRLGGNVQDTGWSQQEFESENNEARITWTYVPDGDCSIQMWNLDGTKVDITKVTVEKATTTFTLAEGLIMEEPIHIFNTPGLYTLDLEEQNDLNLEGENVNLEITLVSLAPFEAMVENHDEEKEDAFKASPSNAAPLYASPSNTQPGSGMPVVEKSGEDDILVLRWKGIPDSGKLDITVSSLTEGAPVYIEHVEAVTKEKEDSNDSNGGSGGIGTQQPARKEDEITIPGADEDQEEPGGDDPDKDDAPWDETPEKYGSTADSGNDQDGQDAWDENINGSDSSDGFAGNITGGAETGPSGNDEFTSGDDVADSDDIIGDSTTGGSDGISGDDTTGGSDGISGDSTISGGDAVSGDSGSGTATGSGDACGGGSSDSGDDSSGEEGSASGGSSSSSGSGDSASGSGSSSGSGDSAGGSGSSSDSSGLSAD